MEPAKKIADIKEDFLMSVGLNNDSIVLKRLSLNDLPSNYSKSFMDSRFSTKSSVEDFLRKSFQYIDMLKNSAGGTSQLISYISVRNDSVQVPLHLYLGLGLPSASSKLPAGQLFTNYLDSKLQDFFDNMPELLYKIRKLETKTILEALRIMTAICYTLRSAVEIFKEKGDNIEDSFKNLIPVIEEVLKIFKAITSREVLETEDRIEMVRSLQDMAHSFSNIIDYVPPHINIARAISVATVYSALLCKEEFPMKTTEEEMYNPIVFNLHISEVSKNEWLARYNCAIDIGETESCAICIEDICDNKSSILSGCKHVFHTSCLQTWTKIKQT